MPLCWMVETEGSDQHAATCCMLHVLELWRRGLTEMRVPKRLVNLVPMVLWRMLSSCRPAPTPTSTPTSRAHRQRVWCAAREPRPSNLQTGLSQERICK